MKEEEIIEGNELIRKFLNINIIKHNNGGGARFFYSDEFQLANGKLAFDYNLKFHSDWNWLMNVIKKISIISNNNLDADVILRRWDKYHFLWVEINRVWIDCIEFIKWYNTQTNNNSSHQEE